MDEIKNATGDFIENINNIDYDQVTSISGLIDKIVDGVQDEIDKYSEELSDVYEKFKDSVNPIFKDNEGNINWKFYLPVIAGVSAIQFFREHPDKYFEIFSKIYDTGKKIYDTGEKAFNFIDEKTDGKFSKVLKKIPRLLDHYILYKKLKDKGYDKFTVDDGEGGRITYLEYQYEHNIKDMKNGPIELGTRFLFGSPLHYHTTSSHQF